MVINIFFYSTIILFIELVYNLARSAIHLAITLEYTTKKHKANDKIENRKNGSYLPCGKMPGEIKMFLIKRINGIKIQIDKTESHAFL